MKMGQNMMKFDENQWFWVEKYDFGVIKMILVVKKHVFMMILGQKLNFWKNKTWENRKIKKMMDFDDSNTKMIPRTSEIF